MYTAGRRFPAVLRSHVAAVRLSIQSVDPSGESVLASAAGALRLSAKPRRIDMATRIGLTLLSRLFDYSQIQQATEPAAL